MNKNETIAAMKAGHRVEHRYFMDDEFIYMKGDLIYSEDGVLHDDFWKNRNTPDWDKDWSIVIND